MARRNTEFTRLGRRNETFDVEGIQDVANALAEMSEKGRNRAMTAGFDEGSAFILHEMKRRAPDPELRDNLVRVVRSNKSGKNIGKVTGADIGPSSRGKRDRWWSDRARWYEFGTKDSRKKGGRIRLIAQKELNPETGKWSRGGRHGRTYKALNPAAGGGTPVMSAKHRGHAAHPFMRPTIDENVAEVAEIVLDAIRREAKQRGFNVR